ncbi:serine hydrolase domain-containing protein [Clostridium hydrogenum]|uniref:serine hydrolase domain-containing protein n=1 Tax=Clostridium hydrogenum TaxID=2855764 RepID=UPI001F1FF804|nr:serine hydrolase [Clostridium hydrogenum]
MEDINQKKLSELEDIISIEYKNINGIVVLHKGNIIFEKYYNGYDSEDALHVASVTKSIVSALIGIAIDKGYIKSVNQRVLDFFPEYVYDHSEVQKRAITIRHLLTMTAPYPFKNWHEPFDRLCRQPDWIKYTLDGLGQGGKIGDFKYSSEGVHLLSAIITRSTGKSAREFANENLFRLIGMREIPDYPMKGFRCDDLFGEKLRGWVKDPKGNSTGGWGITLTPRDMVRFGLLYLKQGIWNGEQVIPKAWIDETITAHSEAKFNKFTLKYGYLWWLKEDNGLLYSAIGDGGNIICCIPDKELVIAITAECTGKQFNAIKLLTSFEKTL